MRFGCWSIFLDNPQQTDTTTVSSALWNGSSANANTQWGHLNLDNRPSIIQCKCKPRKKSYPFCDVWNYCFLSAYRRIGSAITINDQHMTESTKSSWKYNKVERNIINIKKYGWWRSPVLFITAMIIHMDCCTINA